MDVVPTAPQGGSLSCRRHLFAPLAGNIEEVTVPQVRFASTWLPINTTQPCLL